MQNSPKLKNKFKSKLFDILSKKSGNSESQEPETVWTYVRNLELPGNTGNILNYLKTLAHLTELMYT